MLTKVVRLKKGYGRKRLVIVHEQAELSDTPRFLLSRCAALGERANDSSVELSLAGRSLSRVQQTSHRVRIVSGAQGGSGQTPLLVELRSAVGRAAGGLWRGGNRRDLRLPRKRQLWARESTQSLARRWAECCNLPKVCLLKDAPAIKS